MWFRIRYDLHEVKRGFCFMDAAAVIGIAGTFRHSGFRGAQNPDLFRQYRAGKRIENHHLRHSGERKTVDFH